MARRPRLALSGVPQHVIQRGNNRQATFFAEADYRFYLECLHDASCKYDCRVHAYVLMTNHVHILVTPQRTNGLSFMMQHVGRRYVQYVNHVYRRSGTLWEGRFRASLVDTESYFLRCARYIELNPVRAAMADHPGEYQWSSYRCNALGAPDRIVVPHVEFERLGTTPERRQQRYRELFRFQIDDAQLTELRNAVNQGWALGSERFKLEIENVLRRTVRPPKRGRPRQADDDAGDRRRAE